MKRYKPVLKESTEFININYLTKLYKEFNKKYFDNNLKLYPIKVKSLKGVAAAVVSVGIRNNPETWEIKEIKFSDQLIYSEEEVKGVMIHEMIHVKLIENKRSEFGGQHGIFFKEELENLQKKVSFKIPITEDITGKQVNKDTMKSKFVIAIVLNTMESIAIFDIKIKNTIIDNLKTFPEAWLKKYKPKVILSNNIDLLKYPIQRIFNIKKYKNYHIDKSLTEDIIKNGELLYETI